MAWRFLFVSLAAAAIARDAPLMRDARWTQAGPMLARDLTHAPGECLGETNSEIELGRALFRSSILLGGPAARIGLSCHSCHANGRVNARFLLPELTDRAGAADVTSEWASAVRGDGVMNPRAIPDLVDAGARDAFGMGRDPSLEHFVASVIEEEFQGEAPPPRAFAGLIAYLRALRTRSCPAEAETRLTLAHAANDVRRALAAGEASGDEASAHLARFAARERIGFIVERLPPTRFARARRELEQLARDLIAAPANEAWHARFDAAVRRLERRERDTYFNERTLARALE